MRKIDPEERVMQYFMTASEQDARKALEKAEIIMRTRGVATKPLPVAKPRTKRDKPQADLELKEPQ